MYSTNLAACIMGVRNLGTLCHFLIPIIKNFTYLINCITYVF